MANSSDGSIKIQTTLDTTSIQSDSKKIEQIFDTTGKKITQTMDNAEKSMKKASTAFDGSKIAGQLNNVTKTIDNTNQKIDLQKQKLDKLKEAYANSADPSQQIKLQEQIVNTESKITSLEGKLNGLKDKQINLTTKVNTESIDNAVANINKAGSSISNVGNSLSTKVTLPIAAAFGMAAKEAGDFEHQMADIAKEVKAKGEDVNSVMSQMSTNSIKWSEDFGQSTDDINKGFLILVKDGYSGAESMKIMETALYTARGANEDLFTVIDKLGGSLEAYGLKTDNAAQTTANMAKMADSFAYISNHTKASISSLGEAFSTVGQTAAALKQPMSVTAAAIGILESSNIDASTAATSLKAGLVNLTKPTKQMSQAMKEMGLNAFDANGQMKSLPDIIDEIQKGTAKMTDKQKEADIARTFGKESLASWSVLVAKGGDYLRNLANNADNATGEVKELSDSMKDTPVNKMAEAKESFHALAVTFGEDVLPSITPLIDKTTELLKSFANLDDGTKQEIIDLALMAAAAGPVLKVIGGLTTGIGTLVNFGGKLATTMGLIGEGTEIGGAALTGFGVAGMAAAGTATALAAGIAGAITYNELLGKSVNTSTDDLNGWEKAVNAVTGGTIKSKQELQAAGLVYKDFGDGVGKNFKDGIKKATDTYHNFEMELTSSNMADKISVGDQSKLTNSINSMIDGAKSAINSRKGEIQSELSSVFTQDGSGIDENEQKVLDIANSGFDEKLSKISEIQGKISDVWTKAIAQHGKLSAEDITQIKNYLVQVQQIKAEVEAKNNAESTYAKNDYSERLQGISAEDASKEYTDASKTVKDNFVKLKATYKTGIDDLNDMEKEASEKGNIDQVAAIKKQIEEKTKAYKDATGKEQSQIREYLNMLYDKNPSLEGKMNEITGDMFSSKDLNSQGDLYKIKQQYDEVANATESGMKRVQDASGKWHDIYVNVDEATGNITSAYDTFTGKFGGYSKKFEDDAKASGDKIKQSMEELQKAVTPNGGGLKIDLDNNAINASTDAVIGKLQTVIDKADGTKVAIQDINGTQVKLEFDKDGALKNINDVTDAINGKITDNPAVVNVDVSDQDALNKFKETEDKADELGSKTPNVETTADTKQADTNLDTTNQKIADLNGKEADTSVKVDAGDSLSLLDKIKNGLSWLSGKVFGTTVEVTQQDTFDSNRTHLNADGSVSSNYTGTNTIKTGLSYVNEHGYETAKNNNVKMLDNGLAFLIGNHYTGGDGINDHMTTVDEMHNDITNQVSGSIGQIVDTLISSLSGQNALLRQVSSNTGTMAADGKQSIQLNEKLASQIVDKFNNSPSTTFSGLENQIESANTSKTKADNMKVEDNYWYSSTKSQLDDVNKQLDALNNEDTTLNSQKEESFDKSTNKEVSSYNKEIELQTRENQAKKAALESQKQDLEDSVNYYKDAAQKEIDTCKQTAEQEVKIAEDKKAKLTQLAEAVTTALKNELDQQKTDAENTINAELTNLETSYKTKTDEIDAAATKKKAEIQSQIDDLDQESTDTTRSDTEETYNNSIAVLKAKEANTASYVDKESYALQIKDKQKELSTQENEWNVTDQKAELEKEITALDNETTAKKTAAETDYNNQKDALDKQLKNTDAYYAKLEETDSLNAQARYILLNSSQQDLVKLLSTYNPQWQNAGQSLADSLLTGLNSQKQSMQDAVSEMLSLKSSSDTPPDAIVGSSSVYNGYATGTSSNPLAGLYNVDEQGFELSSGNSVAYVGQGAAIKNHMQSEQYISSEIASQVAMMKASVLQQQALQMQNVMGTILKSNSNNTTYDYSNNPSFKVEHYHQYTNQDAEDLNNELGFLSYRNRTY